MLTLDEKRTSATDRRPPASVTQLETRFSIARDALLNERDNLGDATGHFLDTLAETLSGFAITAADAAPLDARILGALAKMKPCRDSLLEIVHLAGDSAASATVHQRVRRFLGDALALKQPPRDIIHFNHLWCDHFRFALRELYLATIALLLRERRYEEVARYLEHEYRTVGSSGERRTNFLSFDAYIKTLDEFRARRLRLNRLSVSADVLRDRADLPFVGFDEIMQADFVLCVRGLLHFPQALNRWFPRTLVYAERYEKTGFDLFLGGRSSTGFAAVCTVLGVRDKAELVRRFEQVHRDCRLDQWRFGGCPIPFEAYMGLAALDTS